MHAQTTQPCALTQGLLQLLAENVHKHGRIGHAWLESDNDLLVQSCTNSACMSEHGLAAH
jgi:hypothetical protein